jgi:hypothetical protein
MEDHEARLDRPALEGIRFCTAATGSYHRRKNDGRIANGMVETQGGRNCVAAKLSLPPPLPELLRKAQNAILIVCSPWRASKVNPRWHRECPKSYGFGLRLGMAVWQGNQCKESSDSLRTGLHWVRSARARFGDCNLYTAKVIRP